MDFLEFKKILYPNGQSKPIYRNMVGIDHLILSSEVSVDDIKKACKKVINDNSFDISCLPFNKVVEYQLCYFIIGLSRIKSFKEQLDFILDNSSIAKSWMTTDLCNQYFKKPSFDVFKPYFKKMIKMKGTYQKRFGYVIGLKFAKEKEAAKLFLNNIINDDSYYVYMAQAWLIAEIGIYYFDLIKEFLLKSNVNLSTKRKAISKMIDSYRISDEYKSILKDIRKSIS